MHGQTRLPVEVHKGSRLRGMQVKRRGDFGEASALGKKQLAQQRPGLIGRRGACRRDGWCLLRSSCGHAHRSGSLFIVSIFDKLNY